MIRPVRFFEPLWFDRDFKKSLKSLSPAERENRLRELEELANALGLCRHPTHGPELARWRPSAYHVPKLTEIPLYEYRCKFPMRVVAGWLEPSESDPDGAVLLVAVTLSHDHRRLQEIVARNREALRSFSEG
jgi:hypothetical protein